MEKQTNLMVWVVGALIAGILLTLIVLPSKTETVVSPVTCPDLPALTCPDPVVSDVDTAWKQEVVGLATAEWTEKGYKAIFEELNDIDEKEDISSIVIKSSKVTDFDAFSQDAVVVQELRVYYEDEDGDDVKAYVEVETTIENGEIEDQEISLS